MKFSGSYFVEEGVKVWDNETGFPVTVCFDGSGGLFVNMIKQDAEQLLFELRAVLDGMEHDRERA